LKLANIALKYLENKFLELLNYNLRK